MLLSTSEAAARLGIASRATVIRLLNNGTLRGVRVGHLWKVYASSVDEILKG
jgi:excisionase family DNA binding protein